MHRAAHARPSAGQVVLEDVRAARLAGLRMGAARLPPRLCVFALAFLRSDGSRAANAEMRGFVVRASLVEPRGVFHARAASPHNRTRRLTFLNAGSGHTTSSSSAITIAKMDQRSCSITYQPRNCVDVLPLSCASKKDLTKMERGWLVPYRTLALDLCPQSIGRAPRLHSAAGARLDPHDLRKLRSYTGTLRIKHAPRALICVIRRLAQEL